MKNKLLKYNLFVMLAAVFTGYLFVVAWDIYDIYCSVESHRIGLKNVWYFSVNPIINDLYGEGIIGTVIVSALLLVLAGLAALLFYRKLIKERTVLLFIFSVAIPLLTFWFSPLQLVACVAYFTVLTVFTVKEFRKLN